MTRYLLVCGVLVAGIVGLGLVVKRFFLQGLRLRAAQRSLQVLDVLPLARKSRLMVVRCYDRSFLLGVAENGVTSIAELDAEAEGDPEREETDLSAGRLTPVRPPEPDPTSTFAELLRRTPDPVPPAAPKAGANAREPDRRRGILG